MSPHRTAFVFQDRPTTYAEEFDRTTRLAAQLRDAGVRQGDRMAYPGPGHPAFVETMFTAHMPGAISAQRPACTR
jgi:fatty-acyl-CoA synthase